MKNVDSFRGSVGVEFSKEKPLNFIAEGCLQTSGSPPVLL
jgi:hypothetical protein